MTELRLCWPAQAQMNFSKHQCPGQEWCRLLEAAKRMASRSFLCLAFVVLIWQIGRVNSITHLSSHLSYFSSCLSFLLNERYFSSVFIYDSFDSALCCCCSSFLSPTSLGELAALFSSLPFSLLFLSLLPTVSRQRKAQTLP